MTTGVSAVVVLLIVWVCYELYRFFVEDDDSQGD